MATPDRLLSDSHKEKVKIGYWVRFVYDNMSEMSQQVTIQGQLKTECRDPENSPS